MVFKCDSSFCFSSASSMLSKYFTAYDCKFVSYVLKVSLYHDCSVSFKSIKSLLPVSICKYAWDTDTCSTIFGISIIARRSKRVKAYLEKNNNTDRLYSRVTIKITVTRFDFGYINNKNVNIIEYKTA